MDDVTDKRLNCQARLIVVLLLHLFRSSSSKESDNQLKRQDFWNGTLVEDYNFLMSEELICRCKVSRSPRRISSLRHLLPLEFSRWTFHLVEWSVRSSCLLQRIRKAIRRISSLVREDLRNDHEGLFQCSRSLSPTGTREMSSSLQRSVFFLEILRRTLRTRSNASMLVQSIRGEVNRTFSGPEAQHQREDQSNQSTVDVSRVALHRLSRRRLRSSSSR